MRERTKLGLGVLEAALLLGLLGDALLRATPWGLNVFLWTATLVVASWALARRRRISLVSGEGDWILPSVLLFAAAFAWRDSLTLRLLDALSILLLLSLASFRARGGSVRLAGLTEYAAGALAAAFNAVFGIFPLLTSDIAWKELPRTGWTRHVWAVARGMLIAVPLLFVFGALFMAADAIFEGIVRQTFGLDTETLATHILLALLFAGLTGGFLRGMLFGAPPTLARHRQTLHTLARYRQTLLEALGLTAGINRVMPNTTAMTHTTTTTTNTATSQTTTATTDAAANDASAQGEKQCDAGVDGRRVSTFDENSARHGSAPQVFSLGIVEIGVVLGLVNLLFISFVVVQIRYFFGGAEWVVSSTGLTYAEYARRGFFELVWVAALVLPLLLGAHWLLRKETAAHERIFRVLAGVQVVLLFVIMLSAVRRMRLYQSEYGMTELRLYTTAFMAWLGLVFMWFAATVLRGRRERFACGALAAGLCVVGLLHVLSPDRFIVQTNAALVKHGRVFDATYASSLSADAVPSLIEAMPEMSLDERGAVASRMLDDWSLPAETDWRTWNWSRAEAWRAVQLNETMLREAYREQQLKMAEALQKTREAAGTRILNPYVQTTEPQR
ncbi:MAG TPA: DUF4173 domain-containing protein [Pyrinomonadaceae bacterium]|jgi:hypothetical protein